MDIAETVKTVIAPPHKAGYPFILGGIAVAVIGLFIWIPIVWIGLIFTLFCLYFFRDPERVPPLRPNVFLAPADGLVVHVDTAIPPVELGLGLTALPRVAIFLSVLDVHVNRAPIAGTVTHIAYHPGKFLSAADDKASDENERNGIVLRLPGGQTVALVQIAGLIARRIVGCVSPGQVLFAGERVGLIRFGSRTDLYLPVGTSPLVVAGQRMIGGETVIAEFNPVLVADPILDTL
jgi:phosphatidylserine decarboxylase